MTSPAISLDQILQNALDGMFVIDRFRRIVMFNAACERITGYAAHEVMGLECKCGDVVNCHDEQGRSLSGALCPAMALFNGEATSARQRMRLVRRDGAPVWIDTIYTAIHDQSTQVNYVLGVLRDASESKAREDDLREEMGQLRQRFERLSSEQKARYGFDSIVSKSPAMAPVFEKMRAALGNLSAVLIQGESGTGKEVVARTIHLHGLHSDGPFVPLNCSALPRELIESELFGHARGAFTGAVSDYNGLFRAAEGGTLFLDEVGAMPSETQAKLLRALQDKRIRPVGSAAEVPVRVRVIAAMNQPAHVALAAGSLREDLYYRLSVIGIALPPLRERREDIPLLVQEFIAEFNKTSMRQVREVAPEVWQMLGSHAWPGNVRELSNAVESAFAMGAGPVLQLSDFPPEVRSPRPAVVAPDCAESFLLDPILEKAERMAIERALASSGGQRNKAARLMGVSRSRLYRRMEALGIDPGGRE